MPSPPADAAAREARRKIRDSCSACAGAKVRCDREKPSCTRCRQRSKQCNYEPSRRCGPRGPRSAHREQRPSQLPTALPVEDESNLSEVFRDFTWVSNCPPSTPNTPQSQDGFSVLSPASTEQSKATMDSQTPAKGYVVSQAQPDSVESSFFLNTSATIPSDSKGVLPVRPPDRTAATISSSLLETGDNSWNEQVARRCDCMTQLLNALARSSQTRDSLHTDPTRSGTHEANVKIINIATEVECCGCFSANETLFFLLIYAVSEVLATYAIEIARLSFDGSICMDSSGGEEVVRVANSTLIFSEMPRISRVVDMLGKGLENGQRNALVDDLRRKLAQVRRTAWEAIRPLNFGWTDLLS